MRLKNPNVALNIDGANNLMVALGDTFKVLPLNIDLCGIVCANSGFAPVYHNPYANTFVGFCSKNLISASFLSS